MNHDQSSIMKAAERRAENWHLFKPPARPSAEEVEIYAGILQDFPDPMFALLLGCTPELRSLVHQFGINLTCSDRFEVLFTLLAKLKSRSGLELFIQNEWPAVTVPGGTTLVMGDGSLNMLSRDRQRELMEVLSRQMNPESRLILRLHLRGECRFKSTEEIFTYHRRHSSGISFFSAVRTDLDMLWMDHASGAVDFGAGNRNMDAMHRDGLITGEEWNSFSVMAPFNQISLHYTDPDELQAWLSNRWTIDGIYCAQDYPRSELHPIWIMRRTETKA